MSKVNPKKLAALVNKNSGGPKAPPFGKKGGKPGGPPGGGGDHGGGKQFGGKPAGQHAQEEAEHEGEDPSHEQDEHDQNDGEIAEQQAARIANGNGDGEIEDMVDESDHEEGEKPAWAVDGDIWDRAEKAVAGLPDVEEDQKLLVIAHTYDALGGEIEGKSEGGPGGDAEEGGEQTSDDYEDVEPADEP